MFNATFKMDGCTTLRIGTDLYIADASYPRGYVAMLLEYQGLNAPDEPMPPVKVTTLGVLKPSAARAVASALLSCATEAAGKE